MIDPIRTKIVRQSVLEALNMSQGFALVDVTLRNYVSALIRPEMNADEWKTTLDWLEKNQHVVKIKSEIDDDLVQWSITERGRTLLATL